jgi:hypothetical protein
MLFFGLWWVVGLPGELQAGGRRTDTRAGSVFGRLLEAHISPSQSISK